MSDIYQCFGIESDIDIYNSNRNFNINPLSPTNVDTSVRSNNSISFEIHDALPSMQQHTNNNTSNYPDTIHSHDGVEDHFNRSSRSYPLKNIVHSIKKQFTSLPYLISICICVML